MIRDYAGFIGGTYRFPSARPGVEICRNMYPIVHRGSGVKPPFRMTLHRTPGTRVFATAGNGPITALFHEDGRAFAVSGSEYYELTASGGATKIGDVAASQFPVRIVTNGTAGGQNMVMSGGYGYIHTLATNAFAQITDADFPATIVSLAFSDSYFLVSAYNTRRFQFSGRFDGTTWSSGDLAEKSQSTDMIRALEVVNKEVWLIGSRKTEIWRNEGDTVATFAPAAGVLLEHGIGAVKSLVKVAGTIAFIGETEAGTGQAYFAQGYGFTRISDDAVEAIWASYSTIDDAYAWTYQIQGHTFYVVTFPSAPATWAYDFTTTLWHEMSLLDVNTGVDQAHLGRCHALAFGKHLVGSRIDGSIYELTQASYYDDDTVPIVRRRRAPHVMADQSPVTVNRFEMRASSGIANQTGQGSTPRIMLAYSVNGGKTFSNELLLDQGALGDYGQKVGLNHLGQGDEWVFDLSSSEPIDHVWGDASLDLDVDAP